MNKDTQSITLIQKTIDEMTSYLSELKETTQIHHKYFGVVFQHNHNPKVFPASGFQLDDEVYIYENAYSWSSSKRTLFRRAPDAMASALRISYYHCTEDVNPEIAHQWLLKAAEIKGVLDYSLFLIEVQQKGPAKLRRVKKSTHLSKQACLVAMHRYTPKAPGQSRAFIIEQCTAEVERILIVGGAQLSCNADDFNKCVSVWLSRDDTFKKHFQELLTIIKRGVCPKEVVPYPSYDEDILSTSEFNAENGSAHDEEDDNDGYVDNEFDLNGENEREPFFKPDI